jgi:hypothetical protein
MSEEIATLLKMLAIYKKIENPANKHIKETIEGRLDIVMIELDAEVDEMLASLKAGVPIPASVYDSSLQHLPDV